MRSPRTITTMPYLASPIRRCWRRAGPCLGCRPYSTRMNRRNGPRPWWRSTLNLVVSSRCKRPSRCRSKIGCGQPKPNSPRCRSPTTALWCPAGISHPLPRAWCLGWTQGWPLAPAHTPPPLCVYAGWCNTSYKACACWTTDAVRAFWRWPRRAWAPQRWTPLISTPTPGAPA